MNGFCAIFGVNIRTLSERSARLEIRPDEEGKYKGEDLYRASIYTEQVDAVKRKRMAEAEIKEIELAKIKGELYDADRIKEAYMDTITVIASRISALPLTYSARCNPAEPEVAKLALEQAKEYIMAPIEEKTKEENNGKQ